MPGISFVHFTLLHSSALIFVANAVSLHNNLDLPRFQVVFVNFEGLSEELNEFGDRAGEISIEVQEFDVGFQVGELVFFQQ